MNKHWDKFFENWTSFKWWGSLIATALLILGYISELTWAGIFGGLMGIGRIAQYIMTKVDGGKK